MEQYEQLRFDDFHEVKQTVECNNCERYYVNQCDGVNKGENKPCREFLAVRNVNIPEELESLRERVNSLNAYVILLGITLLIHIVGGWIA